MYSKILVSGKIEIVTGMHIGGSDAFAAIGAVDSPVIKDNRTKEPIIPGSSLKGKMRTLLARSKSQKIIMEAPDKDDIIIRRLFGSLSDIAPARLIFSDCFLVNAEEMKKINKLNSKAIGLCVPIAFFYASFLIDLQLSLYAFSSAFLFILKSLYPSCITL